MQREAIMEAIQQLPIEEQRKLAEEVLRQVDEQAWAGKRQTILAAAGSWQHFPEENTDNLPDEVKQSRQPASNNQFNWADDHLPSSLLSPEDEKNVWRIWKSPGGC
jgi:hypothetical protein